MYSYFTVVGFKSVHLTTYQYLMQHNHDCGEIGGVPFTLVV